MKHIIVIISFLIIVNDVIAQVTDIDGNYYKTVKIGKQEWMSENLNVSHFRNGDSITEAEGSEEWMKAGVEGKAAWCYYNSDAVSGKTYHRLYNWYAVNDPRGLAPIGWQIPSTSEWANLTDYLGGENVSGTKMKDSNEWNGTNESGFASLPGGYRNNIDVFSNVGKIGSWWSSSQRDTTNAWSLSLSYASSVVSKSFDSRRVGLSVRCLRD
jgi:uncharacterized protein (TIGR02145 family)